MKKVYDRIIWAILCVLCLIAIILECTSCNKKDTNEMAIDQEEFIDEDACPDVPEVIVEFGYHGHDYIDFQSISSDGTILHDVIHSPNCQCQFNNKKNNKK